MRAMHVVVALLLAASLVGCEDHTLITAPDGGRSQVDGAVLDAGSDAGVPIEPIGGSACDQQDDCEACQSCALGPHQLCVDLILACEEQSECVALVECMNPCPDVACMRQCADAHPSAVPLVRAVQQCRVCEACPADCRDLQVTFCQEPPF